MKKILLYGLMVLLALGCAKERPIETVYKDVKETGVDVIGPTQSLSSIDPSARSGERVTAGVFLYVPSTSGAPKDVAAAAPFFKGDEKLVKIKFSESGLEILELEKDSRFQDNQLNHTPVLFIPSEYKDYRCVLNAQGECTNKEEENTQIPWYEKKYFKPSFSDLKVNEVNSLDLFNLDSTCISENGSGLINYEMGEGVINIELEKTYKVSTAFECIGPLYFNDQLSKAGFKVRYHYSLVRIDKLVTPDYQPLEYPLSYEDRYGFFKTKIKVLDQIYDPSRPRETTYVNRWNPARGVIDYYLSDNFNKTENEYLKVSTYEAFKKVNEGLEKAHAGFRLELHEAMGKVPGDLRSNMINLIDEPLANGLLGYGPSDVNPRTGEIVHAYVNMYSGVLQTTFRSVYQSMVDLSIERAQEAKQQSDQLMMNLLGNVLEVDGDFIEDEGEMVKPNDSLITQNLKPHHDLGLPKQLSEQAIKKLEMNKDKSAVIRERILKRDRRQVMRSELMGNENEKDDLMIQEERRQQHLGKMGACTSDLINVNSAQIAKKEFPGLRNIEGIENADKTLKEWDQLNDLQKNAVIALLMPATYVPTLVHELGHNLGLRHNFKGSYDFKNYFNEAEAQEMGMHTTPVYSSIMDYSYSVLNELPVLGKYDIAALRFAYANEVKLKNGSYAFLKDNLSEDSLYSYLYCTDENAGLSATCNRFDEGSSIREIAEQTVKQYNTGYKYRNFRNGRAEYSTSGMTGYVAYVENLFFRARSIYEDYEFYQSIFGQEAMENACKTQAELDKFPICKDIKDIREATGVIGGMFLDILKTPDLTCVIAAKDEPNKALELVGLGKIFEDELRYSIDYLPKSCFDPVVSAYLQESYKKDEDYKDVDIVVIGENGRYFDSHRENNPNYKYVTDISVRGNWADKLLAMKFLSVRYLGIMSTEDNQSSLLDVTSIGAEAADILSHLVLKTSLKNPLSFHNAAGATFKLPYKLDGSYVIPEQPSMAVIKHLKLPATDDVEMSKQLMLFAARYNQTQDLSYQSAAKDFVNALGIYKKSFMDPVSGNLDNLIIDNDKYIATVPNVYAKRIISSVKALDVLKKQNVQEVKKIHGIRFLGEYVIPQNWSEDDKTAAKVPQELWELIDLAQSQYPDLDEAFWLKYATNNLKKPELATPLWIAYKLGAKQIAKIRQDIKKATAAPHDASAEVKKIYQMPEYILSAFLGGKLESLAEDYKTSITWLPVLN
ncbi:MAG: zinc-dependent metalloprotease [Pseudomonadota bacterium]